MSATGAAGGGAAEAQGIAVSDLLGYGSQEYENLGSYVSSFSDPALNEALGYYMQLVSGDPSEVSQAAAPQIENVQTQAQGAKQQISQLPRGGEQNYLTAQVDENTATQIGNALNTAITGAQGTLLGVGEQGISQQMSAVQGYQTGVGEAGNLELGAGNVYLGVGQLEDEGFGSLTNLISSLGQSAAEAYGAYAAS